MKKLLIISVSIVMMATAVFFGVSYLLSFRTVAFTLDDSVDSVSIYTSNDKEVGQLSSSGDISLQEGKYYVIPKGEMVAADKIAFTVEKGDTTITINPPYTKEYLNELLQDEIAAIQAAVATKYPTLISGFTLKDGTLYGRGEWYGGLLAPKVSDRRDIRSPYRVVLHKKEGSWEVVRRPEYVLSASRYQEVPISILREVNAIAQQLDD